MAIVLEPSILSLKDFAAIAVFARKLHDLAIVFMATVPA